MIFSDASTQGWGVHMGYLDPFRHQASYRLFGAQCGNFGLKPLGYSASEPPGHDHYRQRYSGILYQQAGRDPSYVFPATSSSGDLFLWLQSQDIVLRARHIPGCLNVIAEHLSWSNQPLTTEWSLHPEIATGIFEMWGSPAADMFATVHNTHLPQFMSPIPEPQALGIENGGTCT